MSLTVVSIGTTASKLERPFALVQLATIGDLAISLYLCQGRMKWHEHLDEDELFLVHEGVVVLETARGKLTLHSEEAAVVPKGVSHRSRSDLRSVVVLIRPAVLSDRKNGHRQRPTDADPPLQKVRLSQGLAQAKENYQPVRLAQIEDYALELFRARGQGRLQMAPAGGMSLIVVRGSLEVDTGEAEAVRLEAGDMTVAPAGIQYRLTAKEEAVVLMLGREGNV